MFDCDGVILDSNPVKTEAFYESALPYGGNAAKALVDYHIKNGGISRYEKFEYFLKNIIKRKPREGELDKLLSSYAKKSKKGLLKCKVTSGLEELREKTRNSKWILVSGGKQEEIREVFRRRKINTFFDGGVFGSPDSKDTILKREIDSGNIKSPAVFLGDTKYDYEVATRYSIDFIFLYDWTELEDWKNFLANKKIRSFPSISTLTDIILS